jgi:hypothetical protein
MKSPATHAPPPIPSNGYGPPIDVDLDIDLGPPENPIDDINLGKEKRRKEF